MKQRLVPTGTSRCFFVCSFLGTPFLPTLVKGQLQRVTAGEIIGIVPRTAAPPASKKGQGAEKAVRVRLPRACAFILQRVEQRLPEAAEGLLRERGLVREQERAGLPGNERVQGLFQRAPRLRKIDMTDEAERDARRPLSRHQPHSQTSPRIMTGLPQRGQFMLFHLSVHGIRRGQRPRRSFLSLRYTDCARDGRTTSPARGR